MTIAPNFVVLRLLLADGNKIPFTYGPTHLVVIGSAIHVPFSVLRGLSKRAESMPMNLSDIVPAAAASPDFWIVFGMFDDSMRFDSNHSGSAGSFAFAMVQLAVFGP